MGKQEVRILCPAGHLGFIPIHERNFRLGADLEPDYYCCNSGSHTIEPVYLGSDTGVSLYGWQKHDLELMLLASRKQGVPMLIGSAGDIGTNSKVNLYVQMIEHLAHKHNLAPFKLVYFYSEVAKDLLKNKLEQGISIEGLADAHSLTCEDIERTDRLVAVAGVHPFLEALQQGADVIIGGRSSGSAPFASAAIYEGFPEHLAYAMGHVLEGASFCAEPFSPQEPVIGTISHEDVLIRAVHPQQRCTLASVTRYLRRERCAPYYDYVAGGVLDMTDCQYRQYDDKTLRISGATFIPADDNISVKLEGAGKVGERFVVIVRISDLYTLHHLDDVLAWGRTQLEQQFVGKTYNLVYRVYGKHDMPDTAAQFQLADSPDVGVLIEGIAETEQLAEELTVMAMRYLLYAPFPNGTGLAGVADPVLDSVLLAPSAYCWTINHTISIADPLELFELHEIIIGA